MKENDQDTRDFFNNLARKWDVKAISEPERIHTLLARLPLHRATRILDLGCGTGVLFPLLKKLCDMRTRIYAIDYASCMTEQALQKERDSIHVVCGDAQMLPFQDSRFDFIIAYQVVPHIDDLNRLIQECRRILSPSGELVIVHLNGSDELNAFHASLDGPVKSHCLLAGAEMSRVLKTNHFQVHMAIDRQGEYFIRAVNTK